MKWTGGPFNPCPLSREQGVFRESNLTITVGGLKGVR